MDDNRLIEMLKNHSDSLSELIEDPHPGLLTWWDEVHKHWGALARLWIGPNETMAPDDNLSLFEVTNRNTRDSRRIRASSEMGAIKISCWPPDVCTVARITPAGNS